MKTICLGTTKSPILPTTESNAEEFTPSSDEQRYITSIVRNIRRLAAYRLKKTALDYAKVHTAWTPRTIILSQGLLHGA